MVNDNEKLNNSAGVNRPQIPNDIRLPSVQGLIIYWHMGSSRKAKAMVAITEKTENNTNYLIMRFLRKIFNLLT